MKKHLSLIVAIAGLVPASLLADPAASDTTFRYRNKVIRVEDHPDQVKVKVFESKNGMDTVPCKQLYEGIYSDGKSYETWSVIDEIGIQLPGLGKPKSKKGGTDYRMEPHYAGWGIGFMNVTDNNNPFHKVSPSVMSLSADETTEWFINFIEHCYPLNSNRLGLVTGMGINWRTYRLDQNQMMVDNNGMTQVVPFSMADGYEYSRLKVTHITLPLLLEWQPAFIRHSFISGGVEAGIKTYATYKVKYRNNEGDVVRKVTDRGLNTKPLSFDLMLQAGIDNISIFAKQSLTGVFQKDKGPDIKPVSVGFMLNF